MKVSTRGRYGLRAMVDLAANEESGSIPLRKIAAREQISVQYLEQIFVKLRRSGLVKSIRGAHGGYNLNKKAQEISIGDIIRVLEGPIAPVDCLLGENCEAGGKDCVSREIWKEVSESIENVLDSMTLKDLKDKIRKKGATNDE